MADTEVEGLFRGNLFVSGDYTMQQLAEHFEQKSVGENANLVDANLEESNLVDAQVDLQIANSSTDDSRSNLEETHIISSVTSETPLLAALSLESAYDWLHDLFFSPEHQHDDMFAVVGQVELLNGSASVLRKGEQSSLERGDDILAHDTISTSARSMLRIEFTDGMEFTLGSDAKLLINEFVFNQAASTGLQSLSAIKGAFAYQSGLLAQVDPEAVTIKTALGTLGIRGTKLLGLSDYPEGTCVVTLLQGQIQVDSDRGDSVILSETFDTAKMKVGWEHIDKSKPSRAETIDRFSESLFGGDEKALEEFFDDKNSSLIDTEKSESIAFSIHDIDVEGAQLLLMPSYSQ